MTNITQTVEVEEVGQLEALVAQSGLEPSKAAFILAQFQDYFKIAAEWEQLAKSIVVTSPDQVSDMQMAREGRLFLKNKRIAIEKARKELKEQSLREGKAIDAIANALKGAIEPIEEYLDAQEHFVEIAESNRVTAMVESRRIALAGAGINPAVYNLALMTDVEFNGILDADRRRKADEAIARQKAEEERVAQEAESRRVREENDRLRAEMAEKERVARAEREAAEAESRKERDAAEARSRAERELAQKRLEEERMERDRLEAELRAKDEEARNLKEKAEAEEKARADAQAAEQRQRAEAERRAAQAPDREKLLVLAFEIEEVTVPDVTDPEIRAVVESVVKALKATVEFLRKSAVVTD